MGLACLCVLALAQPPGRFPTQSFGFQEGLTNLSVNVLAEDPQGFVWAGTESGLFRYGGHRFQEVPLPRSFRYVTQLVPTPTGFWVGTHNGLGFLETPSLTFRPAANLPEARTSQLGADHQGRIWVLLAGLPPQVQDREGRFAPAAGWPGKGRGDALFAHPDCADVDIADGRDLWRWKAREKAWVRSDLPFRTGGESTLALARDGEDHLWVRSNRNLYRQAPGRGTWTTLPRHLGGPPPDAVQMGRDREGSLWLNTVDAMYRVRAERIDPILGGPKGFVPLTGLVDREGSFWLGSIGVAHVLGRGLWQLHSVDNGLPSNVVWHMARDRRGRIWLATDAGLVVGTAQSWKVVRSGQFSRLRMAPDGSLLAVGSPGGELYRIDPETERIETIRVDVLPLSPVSRGLAIEPDGSVWVSDFMEGLARGRRLQGAWVWERGLVEGKAPKGIWQVTQDGSGDIFLATRTNLYILEAGVWKEVRGTLPLNPFSASRAPDGTLWVTYYDQALLTRHRREGGAWVHTESFEPFAGQEDRVIFSQAFDARGRLWVGTSRGLGRLDLAGHRVEAWLSPGEGIPGADANNQGLLLEGDGTLWYGTTEGVGRFRTQDELPVPPLPVPILVAWSSGHQVLPAPGAAPSLQPGQSLQAQFALNAFSLPGGTRLETRLAGIQPEWQPIESYRAFFSALPPGQYLLEVRGNRHGEQAGPALALPFRVRPHWWQTWWAMLLWVSALGGIGWALATLRQRRLETSNHALQQEIQERTSDLQQANQALDRASKAKSFFLASMSHELRTPLNAILLYSELMGEEAQERGETAFFNDVQKIQSAGNHLFTLINGILDLSKIEAGMIELEPASCPILPLFQEVASTLWPIADQRGNTFRIDLEGEVGPAWADATKLLQVFLNLGGNACKFTEQGTITLRARQEGGALCLEVQDTGRGMSEEEQARIFNAFEQANDQIHQRYGGTGLGLAISLRLVELMGGSIRVSSSPGAGSTFSVRLPAAEA